MAHQPKPKKQQQRTDKDQPSEKEDEGETQISWFKRMMLVKYRTMRGLTQQQVADEIYKSRDTVRAYERGRSKIQPDSISDLIKVLEIPEDAAAYLRILAKLKSAKVPIEADGRFNALYLTLCEQFMGEIFEWAPTLFPGTVQTRSFHEGPARTASADPSEKFMEPGWIFKSEREKVLVGRTDQPTVEMLLGEAAFFFLSKEPRELQIEQLDYLTAHDELPGWDIRVLTEPWGNDLGTFSLYGPGDPERFPDVGPPVVYTEVRHSSWVIQDPTKIAVYDKWRHLKWPRSIRYKEYRDAYWRDRLA